MTSGKPISEDDRVRVLRLWAETQLSRGQIARHLNLHRSTVGQVIAEAAREYYRWRYRHQRLDDLLDSHEND
jgi:IS30 family transposase